MKILDIAQGTKEWLELRRTKITATDCAAILGKSRYKSPHMVWREKMGKSVNVDNEAMKRGRDLEPEAREYFNKKFELNCVPVVALSDENPWQMASLDGWDADKKVILEIKCPGESTFRAAQGGELQEEYMWQCMHQLAVCPEAIHNCLCYYFKGSEGVETVEMTIDRSESVIGVLNAAERAFFVSFDEPPLGLLD